MDSKFKTGDVLKFEDGMMAIVASVFPQATNSNEYLYDLWTCYKSAIDWDCWSESELVDKVKVMDHIDISSVVGSKEEDWSKSLKESLDKINSSLSKVVGYDDGVLRVKVDDIDELPRMKVVGYDDGVLRVKVDDDVEEKKEKEKDYAINCRGDAIRKDIKCINETLTTMFDDFYEKNKELKEENEQLQNEIEQLKGMLKKEKKIDELPRMQDAHDIDIWKKGWYDCLESLGYYLNS